MNDDGWMQRRRRRFRPIRCQGSTLDFPHADPSPERGIKLVLMPDEFAAERNLKSASLCLGRFGQLFRRGILVELRHNYPQRALNVRSRLVGDIRVTGENAVAARVQILGDPIEELICRISDLLRGQLQLR